MSLNLDYLDVLYDWKVKAELELEKFEEMRLKHVYDSTEKDGYDGERKLHKQKKQHLEDTVNRYKTAIRVYIAHHNC